MNECHIFSEKHSAMIFTINMDNAEDSLPVTMSEEIKYAAGFDNIVLLNTSIQGRPCKKANSIS